MRCLIHDFAGYSFPIQLSRQLASRGHTVTHYFPAGLPGPKGRVTTTADDPNGFAICGVELSPHFKKYSAHRRLLTHRKYAADLKKAIDLMQPDVVLSGDTPIDIQAEILRHCRRKRIGFVHWVQDVYCEAISYFLRKKLSFGHELISKPFRMLEKSVAAKSNHNIVIAPAFKDLLQQWGIAPDQISVIENWAPLDEMPRIPKANDWSRTAGLGDKPVFLYSGTLGLKHRPDLLYSLAKQLGPSCTVLVISEGVGRTYLDSQPSLSNLVTMDFQPYDRLPEVLASADVLVATLEPEAGQFAVPSKILTYLSARRPVLLAGPKDHLSASILQRSKAGVVVDPADNKSWIEAAQRLVDDRTFRESLAGSADLYASSTFDISSIAARFETILHSAIEAEAENAVPGIAAVGA